MAIQIAVIGGSRATDAELAAAETVGRTLAEGKAVLVCGGLGGVMAAACRGAKSAGGLTVGFVPGPDQAAANEWVDIVVPTGLGEARNILVVNAAAAVVAIGGEYGTLSELGLALRRRTPVVGIGTWALARADGRTDQALHRVDDPAEAAGLALRLASLAT